ncbi:MAG: T9SS type A sorting domain-containing protein [Chitinophagaceae bacterium]
MKQFNISFARPKVGAVLLLSGLLANLNTTAQCPVGSAMNASGNYTSGQTVCITTMSNVPIALNSGATMVVISGGNYVGSVAAFSGSTITVQSGGQFAPPAATIAGVLTNNGTATISSAAVGIAAGASITNNNIMNWSAWTPSGAFSLTNGGCGTMNFNSSTGISQSGTVIDNQGIMKFNASTTISNGSTLNNSGEVYFNASFTTTGRIYNRWKMVMGASTTINTGDSIINLYQMTFKNAANFNTNVRNEGLMWMQNSCTFNASSSFRMNYTGAQLRVTNTLNNNIALTGAGMLYAGGTVNNNSSLNGISALAPLVVNKTISGTKNNVTVNTSMTAYDTTTFTATPLAFHSSCLTTLPVELSLLQASYKNNATALSWHTVTEANSQTFFIEFSRNGVDFTTVGSIPAAGNSNSRIDYNYTHNTTATGTLYYRLREVDIDGKATYSNIASVKANAATVVINIVPNPFTDKLNLFIDLPKAEPITIILYNTGGSMVQRINQPGQRGNNNVTLNGLGSLPSGVYMISVTAGDQHIVQKLVK